MQPSKRAAVLGGLTAGFLTLMALYSAGPAGCGGDGSGGGGSGAFACSFDKRVTDGCDGYGFGPWESGCETFNEDDYVITPDEVCANITDGGYFCEAGCCIDTEFQNISLAEGNCS
ncbi:MAG TPA: hypothetical protein VLJ37_03025 [bacterium]|nr:hypothetical protein [bacterium]